METDQLFNNIRADFVTEIKPLIFTTNLSSIQNIEQVENALKTAKNIVMKSTLQTAVNISARNAYEYFLHNSFPEKLDFEHRLLFRGISATAAAATSTLILDRNKTFGNMVVYPLWQGTYFSILYMIRNSEESKKFLKRRFPDQCKAVMENNFTKTVIETVQNVYRFLNDPGCSYEEQLAKNKDMKGFMKVQLEKMNIPTQEEQKAKAEEAKGLMKSKLESFKKNFE